MGVVSHLSGLNSLSESLAFTLFPLPLLQYSLSLRCGCVLKMHPLGMSVSSLDFD